MRKMFANHRYDVIVISYVHWGSLVDLVPYPAHKVIDTHDFITAQTGQKTGGGRQIGKVLNQELRILQKFEEIWTYSVEEKYIFEQFTGKQVKLIPVTFPLQDVQPVPVEGAYDVLYVASDNPHNVKSVRWFYERVLPLLEKHIKVAVVGKIGEFIPDHDQVLKLGVLESLADAYRAARVVICPMLSGTGVKIKVLEGLSYGKPVVTTTRGVDGLLNKRQNGCVVRDTPKGFAESIQKLLDDSVFYRRIVSEGYSYFSHNHKVEEEIRLLDSVFMHRNS